MSGDMNVSKSTIEGTSMASVMTKRELMTLHILAAYLSHGPVHEEEGYSYIGIAEEAVLQADALLVALHDDTEHDDG